MSTDQRNRIPVQRTSTSGDDRHRPSRHELREQAWQNDLRDALREAATLRHYERVPVGAR